MNGQHLEVIHTCTSVLFRKLDAVQVKNSKTLYVIISNRLDDSKIGDTIHQPQPLLYYYKLNTHLITLQLHI
jgi:hypothetical protein